MQYLQLHHFFFNRYSFLQNRPVTDASFAPDQSSILLTAHAAAPDHDRSRRSFLCVWNVSHPSAPQKVLVCRRGAPSAACFSPLRASMAFCGTEDGAVCAWDLREAASTHAEVAR